MLPFLNPHTHLRILLVARGIGHGLSDDAVGSQTAHGGDLWQLALERHVDPRLPETPYKLRKLLQTSGRRAHDALVTQSPHEPADVRERLARLRADLFQRRALVAGREPRIRLHPDQRERVPEQVVNVAGDG